MFCDKLYMLDFIFEEDMMMLTIKKHCFILAMALSLTTIVTGCSMNKKPPVQISNDLKKLNIDNFENQYNSNLKNMNYFKYSGNVTIGFAMDSLKEARWQKDKQFFLNKAKELNANVRITEANGDSNVQISQAEKLIAEGVNVLVVVPVDAEGASAIVTKAHAAGVKVLSYDRLIKNSDLDYYISYDNEKVGKLQGQAMLNVVSTGNIAYVGGSSTDNNSILFRKGAIETVKDKIDNKTMNLLMDKYSKDWNPNEAYKNVKEMLITNKDKINGIICANDGTASGTLQALKEVGLQGKIPVTGQDADLGACQNIVEGTQLMTVYKPVRTIAEKAVELAVNMAGNKTITTNNKISNNFKDVNSYLLDPVTVTKDNIKDTVIKDGWHAEADVYKNVK